MSVAAIEWAVAQDVDLPAKAVLLTVAHMADGWTATTTGAALARAMRAPARTVQFHLRQLQAAGLMDASARGAITLNAQPIALHDTQPIAHGTPEAQPIAPGAQPIASQTAEAQSIAHQPEPESPSLEVPSGSPESLNNPYSPPNSPNPTQAPNPAHARETQLLPMPRWVELFNAFEPQSPSGKPHRTTPLTVEHITTIQRKYGHLDLEDQVMRFTDHFTANPQKTWAGYSRLGNWLEGAERRRIEALGGRNGNGNIARFGVTANGSAPRTGGTAGKKFPGMEQFAPGAAGWPGGQRAAAKA